MTIHIVDILQYTHSCPADPDPHVVEIRLSRKATVNEMIYRFARFNPITGVMMDIIGAVRRPGGGGPPP